MIVYRRLVTFVQIGTDTIVVLVSLVQKGNHGVNRLVGIIVVAVGNVDGKVIINVIVIKFTIALLVIQVIDGMFDINGLNAILSWWWHVVAVVVVWRHGQEEGQA